MHHPGPLPIGLEFFSPNLEKMLLIPGRPPGIKLPFLIARFSFVAVRRPAGAGERAPVCRTDVPAAVGAGTERPALPGPDGASRAPPAPEVGPGQGGIRNRLMDSCPGDAQARAERPRGLCPLEHARGDWHAPR